MNSLTFAWRNSKSGFSSRCFRLAGAPVRKLSRASTRLPCASSASHRCEPMKPAPPETTARGFALPLAAADTSVDEAELAHRGRHVDVAAVDQHRPTHRRLDPREVKLPELVPLGDEHERVGAARH